LLIPSIDLMGGKIVQLVQGKKKALEFENFEEWIARFSSCPLVQLIDLDAAMGTGDNRALVQQLTQRLPCQVGGGVRSVKTGEAMLASGARRIIFGSSLVREGKIDTQFAEDLARDLGSDKLVFAVDSWQGKVAIRGWQKLTSLTALEMITALEPWCSAFLYTHIDREGLMQGIPMEVVRRLRAATARQLIVAGGITSREEVDQLDAMRVDAVVGMAIYSKRMKV
jgi:phosphoribosylformimino-5-aminoimidazole carboxamide ribotide isomerase